MQRDHLRVSRATSDGQPVTKFVWQCKIQENIQHGGLWTRYESSLDKEHGHKFNEKNASNISQVNKYFTKC